MVKNNKLNAEDEKIIIEFIRFKKELDRFMEYDLESMKSPLRERLNRNKEKEICA